MFTFSFDDLILGQYAYKQKKECKSCQQLNTLQRLLFDDRPKSFVTECPPTITEIGRNTWSVLHSISAYYPKNPNKEQQKQALNFLISLSELYPCSKCRKHLSNYLKKHPPRVESNKAFNIYLCQMHNSINKYLKKPQFDCSQATSRWKGPWKNCK
ncbi:fad-linked sulfhydryl oxidase alr [Anaeramoeba flamelloides]|uniref:Sulfhydryl oxidase n=1 Tax=Anaeramoeba flamelloides TaxID=1746091 RepID=A0AAV7ZGB5_9EUKA|nr:fad-linked sulfhydryl oxidase alr [Anaeramoeba flamelloides]KAJ6248783.1 fad-linked sulfhydryl oxidase alr [Anaeramoeba flamelloides]